MQSNGDGRQSAQQTAAGKPCVNRVSTVARRDRKVDGTERSRWGGSIGKLLECSNVIADGHARVAFVGKLEPVNESAGSNKNWHVGGEGVVGLMSGMHL